MELIQSSDESWLFKLLCEQVLEIYFEDIEGYKVVNGLRRPFEDKGNSRPIVRAEHLKSKLKELKAPPEIPPELMDLKNSWEKLNEGRKRYILDFLLRDRNEHCWLMEAKSWPKWSEDIYNLIKKKSPWVIASEAYLKGKQYPISGTGLAWWGKEKISPKEKTEIENNVQSMLPKNQKFWITLIPEALSALQNARNEKYFELIKNFRIGVDAFLERLGLPT